MRRTVFVGLFMGALVAASFATPFVAVGYLITHPTSATLIVAPMPPPAPVLKQLVNRANKGPRLDAADPHEFCGCGDELSANEVILLRFPK